jgi:hypothetical protein
VLLADQLDLIITCCPTINTARDTNKFTDHATNSVNLTVPLPNCYLDHVVEAPDVRSQRDDIA